MVPMGHGLEDLLTKPLPELDHCRSVPDRETTEVMLVFYKNALSGKMNRCQALRQAALKQMQVVKKTYGHTNPFYWGAFVFLGAP